MRLMPPSSVPPRERGSDKIYLTTVNAYKLGDFLNRGFAGMNSIFDRYGFPKNELESLSRGLAEVIEHAGMIQAAGSVQRTAVVILVWQESDKPTFHVRHVLENQFCEGTAFL